MEVVRETVRRLPGRQHVGRRLPAILLQGETGTGKGLVARLIHRLGPRATGEFVDVNCAAIPETLLEAELFGFERGAFTDARKAKPGLFQTAHHGSIFLDEIGATPEALQAKLLTVIEERVVRRLGGTRPEPADAWIISATNADLLGSVRERRFREDLYHRLAVLTLRLPPLRERGQDVLLLAERFLARVCADYGLPVKVLAADARDRLMAYPWPGNVRELSNVIERVALLTEENVITGGHLGLGDGSPAPGPAPADAGSAPAPPPISFGDAMRAHLRATLDQTGWNISRTAAILNISRNTVRARMEKLGLREGAAVAVKRDVRSPGVARPTPAPPSNGSVAGPASRTALPTVRWERRPIALMRVALMVPETGDVLSDAARALETLIEKVQSFGGRVEALGQRALDAAFGVEPIEDAPRRAAHAAMAMQRAVERIRGDSPAPLATRIAIHATQALVAKVGRMIQIDQEAKEQGAFVLDDLIAAAEPGGIIASPAAGALLERRFDLVPIDGTEETPTALRLVGREGPGLSAAGRMASFVGRHQEMAVLHSRLLAALRGRGQLVSIVGDAGIGKSRLLYEFSQSVSAEQATYIEGRCLSYGSTIPYLPVLDLIRGLFHIAEADDAAGAGEKIRQTLGRGGMDPARLTPHLLDLLGYKSGLEGLDLTPPGAIKVGISEALRQITLGASHRQPLLVVIEDLHWIDQASEELLASMVDGLPGAAVLFVVTYRPGYEPPWANRSFATQLSLPPLSNEDSLAVTRSVLPAVALPHAVAEAILSRAEGNPFFLEELALSIQDRGLAGDLAVPDTVQGVLLSRIGRLPETEQALLQSAAVIGKDVPLPILAAVTALPEEPLAQALRHLSAAEFLYEVSSFPEVKYRFRHALTHEVAYESLRPERRRQLHARIVVAIEASHSDRLLEDVGRLAHHATRGELWEKAVEYSRQAGAKAAARSAHQQAVAYLEQALDALTHLPESRAQIEQAIDVRLDLRNSLHPLGDPERILAMLREAEALARTLDDPRRLARVFSFMTQYFRLIGHLDLAVESAERALALADRMRDTPFWIVANTFLGTAYDAKGEYRKAADILRKSVEALPGISTGQDVRVAGLVTVFARIYLVYCLADMGEFREGLTYGNEGTQLAEAADDAYSLIFATCGIGTLHLLRGDLEPAIRTLERGLTLYRTLTVPVALPLIACALGTAYSLSGRPRDAIALMEEGNREGLAIGRMGGHSLLVVRLGEAYLRAGRLDEADETARRALLMAREKGERGHEAYALHLLGEVATRRTPGDADTADAAFRQAWALAEELSMRPLLAHCHVSRARLECRAGRTASARQLFGAATAAFRELEMSFWLERAEAEARSLA
jgi:transcriptional regulator with AAA-type ATPase domain/tetratricopeptide (TPR) repeat protein